MVVDDEASNLAEFEQLANQGQWSALWDRIRMAPLDRAVPAMRLFRDWLPDGVASRARFRHMTDMPPSTIAAAARPRVRTLPFRYSQHVAFAPDLTQIAVQPSGSRPKTTDVYALPDATLVATARDPSTGKTSPWPCQLVHVGSAIVYLEWKEIGVRRLWRVVRHQQPDWRQEVLADAIEGHAVRIGAIPAGFVIVAPDH